MADLLIPLRQLLLRDDAEGTLNHLIRAAQRAHRAADVLPVIAALPEVPQDWIGSELGGLALAWLYFRGARHQEFDHLLDVRPSGQLLPFRAHLHLIHRRSELALNLARFSVLQAADSPTRSLTLTQLAGAAAMLDHPHWKELYRFQIAQAPPIYRGLARLQFAFDLQHHQEVGEATTELTRALGDLRHDPTSSTYIYRTLVSTALDTSQPGAALTALRKAEAIAQDGLLASELFLPRALLTLNLTQYPVAIQTAAIAREHVSVPDRLAATLATGAKALALMGQTFEAVLMTQEAAALHRVLDSGRHAVLNHLALAYLHAGDLPRAQEALSRADSHSQHAGTLSWLARAECARQAGGEPLPPGNGIRAQLATLRWSWVRAYLPALLEHYAVVTFAPPEWTVRVSLAGPVRVWMSGDELPLRSTRPEAGLLALLVTAGGQVSRERALDALDLPGKTPTARRKALSAAVAALRELLGWPGALTVDRGVLRLSDAPRWEEPTLPGRGREDFFCEGRFDPWVLEWREERVLAEVPG
ncbi:hypothetical protein [Deinococcus soli (ex Cha et al. 2016)]|uniref:Tetratricopeptide (TPR) repeat protein n=2 Tax=Deinococcus soli (ex Cha et al. 2016) TaxID=1309411 RepID=A0ACC6KIS0_9DEIO|nr:hypothetical protein [Deinococcus soli (ex Cha et al. 2016)]MDR6219405.1 tetratricopeptide (TPR) repeat protein [Deinococcus soli (ex Cha et al. 2016)]MDR6327084.1 tetratricopeptide (TPR) repeat protein [Deinococcus soli (ex Cha et al. 2016)]MDR6752450.1 tetratricopeptide (TPR) repeat protein [Deinococcus soli (ex Cha et al. 2016)]